MTTPTSDPSEHSLAAFGWGPRWDALAAEGIDEGLEPGIVVRHDGSAVLVATPNDIDHAHLPRSLQAVAVGDRVLIGEGAVREVLHRASLLQRWDADTGDAQLIAANVDVVVIACGLDRPLRPGRIERFVTLAWDAGAVPVVVCTKADLAGEDELGDAIDAARSAAPGTTVLAVSAITGDGLEELRAELTGHTAVFVGESGAGKSTLLNTLGDQVLAATGETRSGDAKGRHTTTARQLYVLDEFRVIDTPGVREVGLRADIDAVDTTFDDITELADGCRFNDCAHDSEPGCAVTEAVAAGTISAVRLESWRHLRREAASAALRADPVAARRADKRFGRIAREAQRMKRRD